MAAPERGRAADAAAQWDLTELYPTAQAWTAAHERLRSAVATLNRCKGTLGTSAESMFTALLAISDTRRELFRLYGYASLAPMGDEYLALLRRGTSARWTDPCPRDRK